MSTVAIVYSDRRQGCRNVSADLFAHNPHSQKVGIKAKSSVPYKGKDDTDVISFESSHKTALNVNPSGNEYCADCRDSPTDCQNGRAFVLRFPGIRALDWGHVGLLKI